ncbi:MAG: hypothetical protein KAH01_05980 [Caldisericia bacterium]|nr:hypothetical protein [Caldisericia bacterium]
MEKNLSAMFHKGIFTILCCAIIVLCSSCGKKLEDTKIDDGNSDVANVEVSLPGYTSEESEYISGLIFNWNEIEKGMSNLAFSLYNVEFSNDEWKQQTLNNALLLDQLFDEPNHFFVPSSCAEIQKVYLKGIDEYQGKISGITSAMESSDEVTINLILDDIGEENELFKLLPIKMEEIKKLD